MNTANPIPENLTKAAQTAADRITRRLGSESSARHRLTLVDDVFCVEASAKAPMVVADGPADTIHRDDVSIPTFKISVIGEFDTQALIKDPSCITGDQATDDLINAEDARFHRLLAAAGHPERTFGKISGAILVDGPVVPEVLCPIGRKQFQVRFTSTIGMAVDCYKEPGKKEDKPEG